MRKLSYLMVTLLIINTVCISISFGASDKESINNIREPVEYSVDEATEFKELLNDIMVKLILTKI